VIPVGVIVGAIMAARAINAARNQSAGKPVVRANPGSLNALFTILVWLGGIPFFFVALAGIAQSLAWLPVALAMWLLIFPFVTTRYLLVPLGLGRAAYYLMRLPTLTFRTDGFGGALLMAAWAFSRKTRIRPVERSDGEAPRSRDVVWLEARIAKAKPFRGASLGASALALALRGDLEGARGTFESMDQMSSAIMPSFALAIAREWRIADALTRGDLKAIVRIGRLLGTKSRLTWLFTYVARHLTGAEKAFKPSAYCVWLGAPRRRHTYRFVRDSLSRPFGAYTPEHAHPKAEVWIEPTASPIEQALKFQSALISRDRARLQGHDIAHLGSLWERALGGSDFELAMGRRALDLGASRWEESLGAMRRSIEQDLASLIRSTDIPLGAIKATEGSLADRAARRARNEMLTDIELAVTALSRRVEETRALPGCDEWREWLGLKQLADEANQRGGPDLRRLVFSTVHAPVCSWGVWLFNKRKEKAVANAIFAWLFEEAKAVDNRQAIDVQQRNVNCGAH
jgi:hypothetical protein